MLRLSVEGSELILGKMLYVRTCTFSYSSNLFAYSTDATMGSTCEIVLYDIREREAPIR